MDEGPQISNRRKDSDGSLTAIQSESVGLRSDGHLDLLAVTNTLQIGSRMMKFPNKASSRPVERLIQVTKWPPRLSWESKKKPPRKKPSLLSFRKGVLILSGLVDLVSIREIRLGQNTRAFQLHGKQSELSERAFSIIYTIDGMYKTLNLVAQTQQVASQWISGLHILMAQLSVNLDEPKELLKLNLSSWLRTCWEQADVSHNGLLDLDQVTHLLNLLNFKLSKSEVKGAFKHASIGKSGSLDYDSFERLYRMLRFRPEIAELFAEIAVSNSDVISQDEFTRFLQDVQGVEWNVERCHEIYHKFVSADDEMIGMQMDHFSAFLISSRNHIFKKSQTEVSQDMSQPLTNYFINSSHNTYLLGDQLTGESSVEGYIRALQQGCRCVELDCWDGANSQPVIYHGGTLTTRLLFQHAIDAISKYAFVASPYPLILSLETHCSPEQQAIMARILVETLGERLLLFPLAAEEKILPSPQQLMHKILIKAKTGGSGDEMESEDDLSPGSTSPSEILRESPILSVSPKLYPYINETFLKRMISRNGSLVSTNLSQAETPVGTETPPLALSPRLSQRGFPEPSVPIPIKTEASVSLRSNTINGVPSSQPIPKLKKPKIVSKPLADLAIYCKGVSLQGSNVKAANLKFDCMYSINDRKAASIMQKSRQDMVELNQKHLNRVYPSIIRFTSKNFDPIPHWICGTQMVALNFQTYDKPMQLNQAMFESNGNCGYVLRPQGSDSIGTVKPLKLIIQLISSQQLPRAKKEGLVHSTTDALKPSINTSPSIEIEVLGHEPDNSKQRTRTNPTRGFIRTWRESFEFRVTRPDFSWIRFSVYDGEYSSRLTSSACCATFCIFVPCLERGYRHVPLYNTKGERLWFSTLFVKISTIE